MNMNSFSQEYLESERKFINIFKASQPDILILILTHHSSSQWFKLKSKARWTVMDKNNGHSHSSHSSHSSTN
jgi:hypothetical protein